MLSAPSNPCRTRAELEAMLATPAPDEGVRLVVCLAGGGGEGARGGEDALRSALGRGALLADAGERGVLALTCAHSETEAWLTAERVREGAGGSCAVGFCAPAEGPGAVELAARAADYARREQPAGAASAALVELVSAAREVAALPGLEVPERRMRLLRRIVFRPSTLGPVRLEHVTGHCEQVARTGARLAQLMGLPPEEVEAARLTGLLHDLGKAAFPEELLAKRQGLSPGERSLLARHADASAAIASALGVDASICRAVAQHHRRADDPRGEGHEQSARIVCVADALVTMTTDRAYSPARSFAEALAELRRGRGTLFDAGAVVAAHLFGAAAMSLAA